MLCVTFCWEEVIFMVLASSFLKDLLSCNYVCVCVCVCVFVVVVLV